MDHDDGTAVWTEDLNPTWLNLWGWNMLRVWFFRRGMGVHERYSAGSGVLVPTGVSTTFFATTYEWVKLHSTEGMESGSSLAEHVREQLVASSKPRTVAMRASYVHAYKSGSKETQEFLK